MNEIVAFLFGRTWLLALAVVLITAAVLRILRQPRVDELFLQDLPERNRRRLFLASVSFLLTFAIARLLAYANYNHIGPFHDIYIAGRHIHHLVLGIALLLGVGYGSLLGLGSGDGPRADRWNRRLALLYGAGAALTLDEFALWLNLEDVYWSPQGRASVDVVVLFGSTFLIALWGRPFFSAIGRELLRILSRGKS